MDNRYAVIVVGYNRIESMLRTIESVRNAYYGEDNVDLIISLDNSGDDSIVRASEAVEWNYGKKIVRLMPERQGLKKHILSCGDYLTEYEAVAILEDDIIVAPGFYAYMKEAVNYFSEDEKIAGISLYGFEWNPIGNAPFAPAKWDNDNYFIQFAQSWGQIWMRKQWQDFKKWYENNDKIFENAYDGLVPKSVYDWSDKSWLKYHIRYCVDNDKYFVYPYNSFSTNAGEMGEHYSDRLTRYQVSMQHSVINKFNFISLNDSKALKYDAFFENETLKELVLNKLPKDTDIKDVVIDLYGLKNPAFGGKYMLSTAVYDYEIIKSYGMSMRPQEDNIFYEVPGNNIFLYKLDTKAKNPMGSSEQIYSLWNYYSHEKFVLLKEALPVAGRKFANLIKSIIN